MPSLPPLLKAYNHSVNNDVAGDITGSFIMSQARATLLLGFKDQLIAWGHCTIKASCDGITTSTSDLWAVIADIITNNQSTPFSWIIISFDSAGFELLISCLSPSSFSPWSGASINFYAAPISLGGFTGGSIAVEPTATGSLQITASSGSNWSAGGQNANQDPAMAYHLVQSTDGLNTRMMINHGGKCVAYWAFEQLLNPTAGELYPNYYHIHQKSDSATPTVNMTDLESPPAAWADDNNPPWIRLDNDGVTLRRHNVMIEGTDEGYITEANDVSPGPNPADGSEFFVPVDIVGNYGISSMYRGRIPDMYMVRDGIAEGSMFPTATPWAWAKMGNTVQTWDPAVVVSMLIG